jgi:surface polysaccharide O-acyltransferase-like enzyme
MTAELTSNFLNNVLMASLAYVALLGYFLTESDRLKKKGAKIWIVLAFIFSFLSAIASIIENKQVLQNAAYDPIYGSGLLIVALGSLLVGALIYAFKKN